MMEPMMACRQCGAPFDTNKNLQSCRDHFGMMSVSKKAQLWLDLKEAIRSVSEVHPTIASVLHMKSILSQIESTDNKKENS